MKDFYRQLHVEPYAPIEKIRAALTRDTDAGLRADVEAVLFTPRRRTAYDRAHRLLNTVGQLRRRTNLHLRPFWARSGNQDFTAASWGTDVYSMEPRARKSKAVWRWMLFILLIAVIAAGVWLWRRFR